MTPTSSSAPSVVVLANPANSANPSDGAAGRLDTVLTRLREGGLAPEVASARTPDAALAACRAAVERGVAAVVAVGGDGTAHLALQAVAGTGTPLGLVPGGTGNDLAACLGVPTDPALAAGGIADDLRTGTTAAVDAVAVDGPTGERVAWYASILVAGFASAVNDRANRMRWPRGPRRYDVAALVELLRLAPHPFTIDVDGQVWSGPAVTVSVGNTDRNGGGMRTCPDADHTDGLLDLVIVGPVGRAELVRFQPKVYAGTHVAHPQVTTLRGRTVRLAAEDVVAYADGERVAPLPLTLSCVPGGLRMIGIPR